MTATSLIETLSAAAVSALGEALNLERSSRRPNLDGAYLGHVPYFAPRMTAGEKSAFAGPVAGDAR